MDESDHDEADFDESGPELFSPRSGGSYRQPGLSEQMPGWWQGQDGLWYPPDPYCDCDEIAETEHIGGYLMAEIALRSHAAGLIRRDAEIRLPYGEEWLDPRRVRSALHGSDRTKLFART